jgi:ribosomal protein S18 acetylase RimI-like enzyme
VSDSIVVRMLAGTDLEPLDRTYPEPGRPTSRHRERWDLQEAGEGVYLAAWSEEDPIGWVFVRWPGSREASVPAKRSGAAEVVDLYVDPRFRGRGHGSSLLAAAERAARDSGLGLVGLAVTVSNPNNDIARAMYERRGYRESGFGEYEDGYAYWTASGEERWDGEPHRFLIKSFGV